MPIEAEAVIWAYLKRYDLKNVRGPGADLRGGRAGSAPPLWATDRRSQ